VAGPDGAENPREKQNHWGVILRRGEKNIRAMKKAKTKRRGDERGEGTQGKWRRK